MTTHIDALSLQFHLLPSHYQVITIIVYVMMGLTEPLRLYLGYEGNLREKVRVPATVSAPFSSKYQWHDVALALVSVTLQSETTSSKYAC